MPTQSRGRLFHLQRHDDSHYWLISATVTLLLFPLVGAGCSILFAPDDPTVAEVDPDKDNAYTCRCTCLEGAPNEFSRDFNVCLPPELNPNLAGGMMATSDDLSRDCGGVVDSDGMRIEDGRVRGFYIGLLGDCAMPNMIKERIANNPELCQCAPFFTTRFADTCNGGCDAVELASDCSNEETANTIPGVEETVCLAEPGPMGPQPGGVALFRRSTCEVEGDITIGRGGNEQTKPADGVVEISGEPCPGGNCDIGLSYRIDNVGTFKFDALGGLTDAELKNVQASGASVITTTISVDGMGMFPPSTTESFGRGKLEKPLSSDKTAAYVAANPEFVDVTVKWSNQWCAIDGVLLDAEIDGEPTTVTANLIGNIVNQPPTAKAGDDHTVECTSPAGAEVILDATGSVDPEDNIAFVAWRRGELTGEEIFDEDEDGIVATNQELGTSERYFLNVVDAFTQISRDSVVVNVVDTTAPTIDEVTSTPDQLWPPNHKMVGVSVEVETSDVCDADGAVCQITSVWSNEPVNGPGAGNTSPDWEITGDLTVDLRAERVGNGNGRVYTLEVTCTDDSGNSSTRTTTVAVPHSE